MPDAVKPQDANALNWLGSVGPTQTSASYLKAYMQRRAMEAVGSDAAEMSTRLALIIDIWIKANSFAILNKVFFWLALFGSIMIAVFPVLAAVVIEEIKVFDASVLQTAITALTALFAFVYRTYKQRQSAAEALMRYVCFEQDSLAETAKRVRQELAGIDVGLNVGRGKPDEQA